MTEENIQKLLIPLIY